MKHDEEIYAVVSQIPRGCVVTYGDVAYLVGNRGLARVVGNALHRTPRPGVVPCHRVVSADGRCSGSFAFGGPKTQEELLRAEGVTFEGDRVDMGRHRWNYSAE